MSLVSQSTTHLFSRRVSFNDYEPAVISPSDVLTIHPPDKIDSQCHLKSILKKTSSLQKPNSARRVYEIPGTGIKKTLLEMTDKEIMLLDKQFSQKSVDVEKSYRFDSDPRLSPLNNSAAARSGGFSSKAFSLLKMSDYPTKPIIKKNSICLNFKHAKYSQHLNNNKFYLILISKYKSSLAAINFYLENYSKNGDNIVICASISNVFDPSKLQGCILDLVDLILAKIVAYDANLAIQINFEFFRNINYMSETLNLYQPSLIIVGSRLQKSKYTSIATSTKNFVPLVYVGVNYKAKSNSTVVSGGVTFRTPFSTIDEGKESRSGSAKSRPQLKTALSSPQPLSPTATAGNQPIIHSSRSSLSRTSTNSVAIETDDDDDDNEQVIDDESSSSTSSESSESESDSEESNELEQQGSHGSMSSTTKVKPEYPFLNAVPHLNHIRRSDREASVPGIRSMSTPSLGSVGITKTKSNPASFSTPTHRKKERLPQLKKVTTVPAVLTPEMMERNSMFERYNRRLSSVKVKSKPMPKGGIQVIKDTKRSERTQQLLNSLESTSIISKTTRLSLTRSTSSHDSASRHLKHHHSHQSDRKKKSNSPKVSSTSSSSNSSSSKGFLKKLWWH